jgi:predicted enzyme involved in methoxymalonyl-ACP biosynthesis
MEDFVLNTLVEFANQENFQFLVGEYKPTPKNQLVANHFLDLGFAALEDRWRLVVSDYKKRDTFINRKPAVTPLH